VKRTALLAVSVLLVLVAGEFVARLPALETPSPFEQSAPGRVRRSEAWARLLPFDVARVPSRPRVVWMGASTVAGVPYMPQVCPPGWLQAILTWRGVDMEVVPMAAPGLTSGDLAHLFPYVLELSPDVIVVTTGHNEYLNAGLLIDPPWWLDIQLVLRARELLWLGPPEHELLPTLEHEFDHGAIVAAFGRHVRRMQALADEAGVALLFTAPLSNLRDIPPVLGDDPRLPEDADAALLRGQALLAAGDTAGARAAFEAARDRDRWPHRATAPLVATLRAGVQRLVPVDAAFDAASPYGVPGFELFADHCHPNLGGQRLLASAVADAIEDLGLLPATGRRGQAPDLADGLLEFGMDDEALARAQVKLARGYVGLALIAGVDGHMAEIAERYLAAAQASRKWDGELDTSFALLALLRGDVEAVRKRLSPSGAHAQDALGDLQRAYDRYPWIRAAFERNGLRLEQATLLPPAPDRP
jgi:lysophospholipase L1-like esterase